MSSLLWVAWVSSSLVRTPDTTPARLVDTAEVYGPFTNEAPGGERRACSDNHPAKKRSGHYLPGRRGWIKTKNRAYLRYPLKVEAARLAAAHPRRGDHYLVAQRTT